MKIKLTGPGRQGMLWRCTEHLEHILEHLGRSTTICIQAYVPENLSIVSNFTS